MRRTSESRVDSQVARSRAQKALLSRNGKAGASRPTPGGSSRVLGRALIAAVLTMATAAFAIENAPSVRILRPQEGERVSGDVVLIEVQYQTNTDRPIERIDIWIDGRKDYTHWLDQPEMAGTRRYQWDSTRFPSGRHVIQARAQDQQGNEGAVSVNVRTGPLPAGDEVTPYITVFSPRDGETLGGRQRVVVDVHGGSPQWVLLLVDGKHLALTTRAPYAVEFDTASYDNGSHTLQAIAKTQSGEIESPVIHVQVQNPGGGQFTPLEPSPATAPAPAAQMPVLVQPAPLAAPSPASPLGGPVALDFGLPMSPSAPLLVVTTPTERPIAPVAAASPAPATPATETVSRAGEGGAIPVVAAPSAPAAPPSLTGISQAGRRSEAAAIGGQRPAAGPIPSQPAEVLQPPRIAAEPSPGISAESIVPREVHVVALPEAVPRRPRAEEPTPAREVAPPPASAPTAMSLEPVKRDGAQPRAHEPLRIEVEVRHAPERELAAALPRPARPIREAGGTPPVRAIEQAEAQLLAIPKSLARVHLVRPGETLWGLARRYGVSIVRTSRANGLGTEAQLKAGSRIIIPPATTVLLDNVPVEFDVAPEIISDTAMASIRHMIETAGGEVEWHPKDLRVTGRVGNMTLEVQVGSRIARIGEDRVLLSLAAFLKNCRVLVPVRFVGEVLKATVRYDPETENVQIMTAGQ